MRKKSVKWKNKGFKREAMKGRISHLNTWLEIAPVQESIQVVFMIELNVVTQSTTDLRAVIISKSN